MTTSRGDDTRVTSAMKVKLDKQDWSEWYNTVVELAELSDKRYPVKGMNIWLPYGWSIMRAIDEFTRGEMARTGHGEVCFPLLIPESEFEKEAEHIKGFNSQVYWVTRGGDNDLDVPLVVRPTSETAMYAMFSLWIRSHSDLPLKIYQIVNVFRYETKMTRTFIRVREIHFFEAHTAHETFEEAEEQIREDIEIMENVSRFIGVPHLKLKRPEWDKFAGAYYSVGVDAIMPTNRTLQIGGIHQYRDNFARPYDIKYETAEGEKRYAHQTTYGMSERLVGTLISIHGDNRGLILPPNVAPIQCVIVPIFKKDSVSDVMEYSERAAGALSKGGIRVHVDKRDLRPGNKYYYWEIKGVPLRIEIGPKDIEKGGCTLVRRDMGEREFCPMDGVVERAKEVLKDIQATLLSRAVEDALNRIRYVNRYEDIPEDVGEGDPPGVYCAPLCSNDRCAREIEDMSGMNYLGSPYMVSEGGGDVDIHANLVERNGLNIDGERCVICGLEAERFGYFAKTH